MAIDRPARDELAGTLAAYMRGEIDNLDLDQAVSGVRSDDPAVLPVKFALYFYSDETKPHRVRATRDGWERLRRLLALLRSDVEWPPERYVRAWDRRVWLGLLSAASIAAAAVLAVMHSPWWLLLPGAVAGVLPLVVSARRPGAHSPDPKVAFHPFQDERQWRTYEPLLAADRLPEYASALQNRPIRGPFWGSIIVIPGSVIWLLAFAPLVSLLFLVPQRRRVEHG